MDLRQRYAGVELRWWLLGAIPLTIGAVWYVRRYRQAKAENATTPNVSDGVDYAQRRTLQPTGAAPSPTTSGTGVSAGGGSGALPEGSTSTPGTPVPAGIPAFTNAADAIAYLGNLTPMNTGYGAQELALRQGQVNSAYKAIAQYGSTTERAPYFQTERQRQAYLVGA